MSSKNIKIPIQLHKLPNMYWLPKLHKDPYGSRFIAASNKCTTKPLSGLLTTCLSTVLNHFKEYCCGISRNTGINCFWIVTNSQHVLDMVHHTNMYSCAKHLDTYDFSTLYTSIPHDSLKHNIRKLIVEAFKVRGAQYLAISKKGSGYWAQTRIANVSINKNELIGLIDFLIDNIFIQVGNKVFRQRIGIPMGTDCGPLLANLFLFYYEYNYMKSLLKNNFLLARKFNNTARYIDDLLTLNNTDFSKEMPNIYPIELILKKTTESVDMVSYLDVSIHISSGKFVTDVFDKRDNFNFHIVNFPFLDSNIPLKPAYGIYISQLVRVGRICDKYGAFVTKNRQITTRLIQQGFRYSKLCDTFKKFSRRHKSIIEKYGVCYRHHIRDGICLPVCVMRHLTRYVVLRRPSQQW